MAEVPYDPSNPYDTGNGDYGGYNYNNPWDFYGLGGSGSQWMGTNIDPSNPYDSFPTGVYVGNTLTGDMGSNPLGISFGGTGITPYGGPTGYTEGGTGYTAGHGSLDPNANPTQYGGTQWPNIGIGIPGLIGVGLGGVVYGGGWDILGGGSSGGGGQSGGGGAVLPPIDPRDEGVPGDPIMPPIIPDDDPRVPVIGREDITGPSRDVLFPPVVWDGKIDQESKNRWPTNIPFPGTSTTPPQGGETPPPATIVPPPIPSGPTENPRPNTIYQPLGNAFPPPVGGGGGSNPPPATTPPPTTPFNPMNRNYLQEGQLGVEAMRQLFPQILGQYGQYSGEPGQADAKNLNNLLFGQYGPGTYNPELTRLANEQTMASNTALRYSNVGDVENLSGRASAAQRAANPELYGMLGAYTGGAQNQLTNDYAAVGRGGQLTPDEIRMAQQSAREAAAAQGRLRGSGTQAAEVLNRFQYQQQRDQQNRANLGQSQQAAMGGMNAAQQASFNPFGTLLGQGMNTQNVGTNQTLFNQGSAFTSGALSNQYVQQLGNPYNPYAAGVYDTNVNAENARWITQQNNAAGNSAANTALLGQLFGGLFNTWSKNQGTGGGTKPTTGTTPAGSSGTGWDPSNPYG